MSADRWLQILDLFAQAVEFPLSERQQFLNRVCQGDENLKRELESLLAHDAPDQRLVDIPADFVASCSGDGESAQAMAGRRIGPYRLISLIGHGGMGAVYLGVRDDEQYQKQVAVKLLKRGMDTDFMLSRFRQERQILANLEHPFIARLIDGGATEDGLPYFVLEYVDGVPITRYCADKNLSIAERLRLFRLVCEAVQYAHQNLVVHRDIKPSNILTTKEGIPKLLDFGIAKVLDPGVAANVTFTQRELRMLTPDYASPEQIKGLPIGTASDTYSLGAVLYELLTSQRPHRFTTGSAADMERTICETEVEKPSSVVARNDELSASLRKQLKRQLSGDLDNIVLTAMRKEPQRRYASAAELSDDLRRHMESLPVLAQEDQWTYRAGKFVRRNRLTVGAAVLVAASLILGIVATSIQARRAEHRFELARRLAKAVVADIKGPMGQLPGSTALRASMIQTVLQYLDGLAQDPGRDPAFELEIADAYREVATVEGNPMQQNLGQTAAALTHYQKAIAIYERHADRAETRAHALSGIIETNIQAGDIEERNGNAAAAQTRLEKVLAIASEAAERDSKVVIPGTWVYLYFRLGAAALHRGAADDALNHFQKALEVCKSWVAADRGVNARNTLRGAHIHVASAQIRTGDLYGARENFEAALRNTKDSLRQPDATVYERSSLSIVYLNLSGVVGNPNDLNFGDRAKAISHASAAVDIAEAIAASDSQDVRARDHLAGTYQNLGAILAEERPAEALRQYRQAARIFDDLSAAAPSNTRHNRHVIESQGGIGEVLSRLGKNRAALEILTRALEGMKSLIAVAPEDVAWIGSNLARIHLGIGNAALGLGDEKRSLDHYNEALTISEDLVRRAPSNLYFHRHGADALESLGRYYLTLAARRPELKTEARLWFRKSLAIWQDWKRRKVGAPYAGVREAQVTALIASIDRV
jgi:eukaryotic-like serine/threonine-protein kinase